MAERPITTHPDGEETGGMEAPPAPPPGDAFLPFPARDELGIRSVRSGFAQLASQGGQLALLVGTGMLLARLLTPTDFGLLAMVSAVTGFVEGIRHFGLPQAALHRDEVTAAQARALFWRTLELSALAALAMAAIAPLLAWFYGEPRVIGIMLIFALAFAIRGLSAVHETVLMRSLRFGRLVLAQLGALGAASVTAVTLAWFGAGYFALVAHTFVLAVVFTATLWSSVPWRPGRRAGASPRREMNALLAYGSDVTRFQMLTYVGRNTDRVLVGFFSGARALGFYDAAYRWSLYPVQQIYAPLTNVALASLARVRHDTEAYRRACRVGLLPVFTIMIPALVFFALEAERTILVLLGDQWGPAVPLFRTLCIGAVGSSMIKITRWLFMAEGQTARQLRWGFVFMPVMVLAVAVGVPWGPLGVAIGYTAGTWLMMPSAVSTCLRDSALRPRDLYGAAARPAAAAVAAAVVAALVGRVLPAATQGAAGAAALLRQGAIFVIVLTAVWLALPGGPARLREFVALLRTGLRAHAPRTVPADR